MDAFWVIFAGLWLAVFLSILLWPRRRPENPYAYVRQYRPTRHLVRR